MAGTPTWTAMPRVRQAYDFFHDRGWRPEEAAGIVANLYAQNGRLDAEKQGDNGQAVGVAQWHPDRQQNYHTWSDQDLKDASFEDQLGFVHHELTQGAEKNAARKLVELPTAQDAGTNFTTFYERPDDPDRAKARQRGQLANELFQAMQGASALKEGP